MVGWLVYLTPGGTVRVPDLPGGMRRVELRTVFYKSDPRVNMTDKLQPLAPPSGLVFSVKSGYSWSPYEGASQNPDTKRERVLSLGRRQQI